MEGEILIPRAGERTFLLTSDDGSDLRIGRDFAIDNLGVHAELTKSGTGTFEKGWQPLRIRFFDIGGGAVLRLAWETDDEPEGIISAAHFRLAEGEKKA